jgi:uncharacterized membrane protein YdjX (TVP38/TMEM64 family)
VARVLLASIAMKTHHIGRRSTVAPLAIAEVPLGILAGAALGAFAGPVGLLAGAIAGSAVGVVLAVGHNRQMYLESLEEERYDREMGIIGGDIGAPNLRHPPPTTHAIHFNPPIR